MSSTQNHLLLMAIFSTGKLKIKTNYSGEEGRELCLNEKFGLQRQDNQCQQQMPEESEHEVD